MRTFITHLQRLALVAALFAIGQAASAQTAPVKAPETAPDAVLAAPSNGTIAPPAALVPAPPRKAPPVARHGAPGMLVAPRPVGMNATPEALTPSAAAPLAAPTARPENARIIVPAKPVEPLTPAIP